MDIAAQNKQKMQAAIEHFKQELRTLRSNRAHASMVDHVLVEAYGSPMRLKELANVTTPESRQLLISPFDPSLASAIVKGIEKANLGFRAVLDSQVIRITIPPMDETMRKEIVKQGKKKAEDTKIAIREIRRKSNELAKKQKADGEIAEDVMKKMEKLVQEQTDKFCKEIDDLFSTKEKEIMTV